MPIAISIPAGTATYEVDPGGAFEAAGRFSPEVSWLGLDDGTAGSRERFVAALNGRYGLTDLGAGNHGRPILADEALWERLPPAMNYAAQNAIAPPVAGAAWTGTADGTADDLSVFDLAMCGGLALPAWLDSVQAKIVAQPGRKTPQEPPHPQVTEPGLPQEWAVLKHQLGRQRFSIGQVSLTDGRFDLDKCADFIRDHVLARAAGQTQPSLPEAMAAPGYDQAAAADSIDGTVKGGEDVMVPGLIADPALRLWLFLGRPKTAGEAAAIVARLTAASGGKAGS